MERNIFDGGPSDLAIWNDEPSIVWSIECGDKQVDFINLGRHPARRNDIPHLERSKDEQQHPRAEITQRALKRKAYRKSCGSNNRRKTGDADTKHAKHTQYGEQHDRIEHQFSGEPTEGFIDFAANRPRSDPRDQFGCEVADHEDEECR